MTEKDSRPAANGAAHTTGIVDSAHHIASRQVSWWEVHVFISELTAHVNNLPAAGTPSWCAMADDNPRKLLALAVAGEHHVLRVETAQQARAEASCDVSAAADWPKTANQIRQHRGAYIPREAAS